MQNSPGDSRSEFALIDVLLERAAGKPHSLAYAFLADGTVEASRLTYAQLDLRARAIAAVLEERGGRGERVLLLFPPGLEFLEAFFGCVYSGAIAVPLPAPDAARLKRTLPRLVTVAADTRAAFVLTNSSTLSARADISSQVPALASTTWLAVENIPDSAASGWNRPPIGGADVAYLQYSSGSTSEPKGIMISHANLFHNIAIQLEGGEYEPGCPLVTWMPHFHDYGLVHGLLLPLYNGSPCYVISPLAFLKRPVRWLQAISRYKATHSQSPTFGYDHCVRKIRPDQCAGLDLSCWIGAGIGAEPVRLETMRQFEAAFEPFGFRRGRVCPVYGLAEATLAVSLDSPGGDRVHMILDSSALEQNRVVEVPAAAAGARALSGSGRLQRDIPVKIVDPETRNECPPGRVGEIWCGGKGIALGYWNRPEETERTFRARLAADDGRAYLRTGDLGFIAEGQLFVTGRLKDLIIVAGANHYPQDIEWTVEASHADLRPHSSAAFSIDVDGQERLVVVAETKGREEEFGRIHDSIRRTVSESHGLDLYAVALLRSGSVPKTSSGKIQRSACRSGFLSGTLEIVSEVRSSLQPAADHGAPTTEGIRDWLRFRFAAVAGIDPSQVDVRQPLAQYGMTSREAISTVADLEDWLHKELSPTLLYQFPTIDALSSWLCETAGSPPEAAMPAAPPSAREPIAIVGIGCRFPGANGPDSFWELMRDGVDATAEVPADRWDADALFSSEAATPGKMNTRRGAFLKDVGDFDPQFFGISPREAIRMDPQQRILMEVAWEAFEAAGVVPDRLAGTQTGVFVGICTSDYASLQLGDPSSLDTYSETGSALSIAANRLSYAFDLRGPSIAIDTACSSSLTAVHLACESLRSGQSTTALAGGVNLMLAPEGSIAASQARMLSDDGLCKAFDSRANGYVRGEGCGLVVLKRMSDAIRDGDPIVAVIRGTAINQDGRSNGLTAPNPAQQRQVVQLALRDAGVSPHDISYVEAHGTGTPLGDPIEFQSLSATLGRDREADRPCLIGSVKTNIGHLEAAAGIAGLIKVALSLAHEEIPPHLHLKEINPYIQTAGSGLQIATGRTPWPRDNKPRLAGVSSFGVGGANAHAIIEEAPAHASKESNPDRPLHLLTVSAKTPAALQELLARYEHHLRDGGRFPEIAYTSNAGRSQFAHRVAIVAGTSEEARRKLSDLSSGRSPAGLFQGTVQANTRPKIAFLFGGSATRCAGLGRSLYESQSAFRRALEECGEFLKSGPGALLADLLHTPGGAPGSPGQTACAQPASFAFQWALVQAWKSWGIEPDAVMGHGIGEYVAACAAGGTALEDGLKLASARERLMRTLPPGGAMASVWTDEQTLRGAIAPWESQVSIAAFHGPDGMWISGTVEAVNRITEEMTGKGIRAERLPVPYASHSPLVEPILGEFERVASEIVFRDPEKLLVLNVTGRAARAGDLTPSYWRRHLREAVQFENGIHTLAAEGCDVFVDIGAGSMLEIGRTCVPSEKILWLPSLKEGRGDWHQLLESVGELYVRGAALDWEGISKEYGPRKVMLPTYPFQRRRYWIDPPRKARSAAPPARHVRQEHPLLGSPLRSPAIRDTVFQSEVSPFSPPILQDHSVYGRVIFPAAAYLEMAVAGIQTGSPSAWPLSVEDCDIAEALLLSEDGNPITLQTIFTADDATLVSFQIVSLENDSWRTHASGKIRRESSADPGEWLNPGEIQARCREKMSGEDLYALLRRQSLAYGPGFQGAGEVWRRKGEALGWIRNPPSAENSDAYVLHPALLDSCLHVVAAAQEHDGVEEAFVPVHVGAMNVFGRMPGEFWAQAEVRPSGPRNSGIVSADLHLFDGEGKPFAEFKKLTCRRVGREKLLGTAGQDFRDWLYRLEWQTKESDYIESQLDDGRWLILSDRGGIGASLREALESQGQRCTCIHSDEQVSLESTPGLPLRGVIHLWALDSTDDQSRVCGSVLSLVKAISGARLDANPRLCLVTRGTQTVAKDTPASSPAGSTLWGLATGLTAEHPDLRTVVIDLDPQPGADEARFILEEALTGDRETRVASRKGLRHVQRLAPVRTRGTSPSPPSLREDSTYLITGGLGAIGLKIAGWMVERGARHLVLAGRGEGSESARLAVDEMRKSGAEILTARVDCGVRRQVADLIARIGQSPFPLRGVAHAAGVLHDGLIVQQDWNSFAAVMNPKVQGAWNLHVETTDAALDFFLLFSSAASFMPNAGQASYAASNAFLDGLAHFRRGRGLPALAVNWGVWQGPGLAEATGAREKNRLAGHGVGTIGSEQALRALDFLLNGEEAQIAVMPLDWRKFFAHYPHGDEPALLSKLAAEIRSRAEDEELQSRRVQFLQRLEEATPSERQEILEDFIAQQVMEILRYQSREQVDLLTGFFEIGMDSLMAVELQHRIQTGLGVSIPATTAFDQPNITALARYLLEKLLVFEKPQRSEDSGARGDLSEDRILAFLADEHPEQAPAAAREKS